MAGAPLELRRFVPSDAEAVTTLLHGATASCSPAG